MKLIYKILSKPYRMVDAAHTLADAVADDRAVRDFKKYKRCSFLLFVFAAVAYAALYILRWYEIIDYEYAGKIVFAAVLILGCIAYAMHVSLKMIENYVTGDMHD